MAPQDFKELWAANGEQLSVTPENELAGLNLKANTIEFLILAGLPVNASPFLSFDTSIKKLTVTFNFLEPEFDRYIMIGSSGEGDIIAIDTGNDDQIVWLDHEDYFSARFFDTSINALAGCLVAYRNFVKDVVTRNGEDAFLNSNFTNEQFEKLKQELESADPGVTTKNGFWKSDLAQH